MEVIINDDKDVLSRINSIILVVPYSYFNLDVEDLHDRISDNRAELANCIAEVFIDNDIHNITICLYDIDHTRYRVNMSKSSAEIKCEANATLMRVFNTLLAAYKVRFFVPCIQGGYFKTLRSITKMVTCSVMFGSSKRKAVKFDARKVNPIFDDDIKKSLEGKLDKVACAILRIDTVTNDDEESVFDKALLDVMTYGFIPDDNHIQITVK